MVSFILKKTTTDITHYWFEIISYDYSANQTNLHPFRVGFVILYKGNYELMVIILWQWLWLNHQL